MRKHYFKFLAIILTTICIILSLILIFMKTYAFKNDSKNYDINAKILSEIDFIDSCVVEAMNKMNNISVTRYKVYTKSINKSEENNTNSENEGEKGSKSPETNDESKNQKKESPDSSEQEEKQAQTNSKIQQSENKDKSQVDVSQSLATNSLTETQETSINWDEITYIYENLYSTWPTIKLDLNKVGIKDEQISKFSQGLNGIAQAINSKDKNSTLVNLYNIYLQLPNYLMVVTQDQYILINYNTKVAVLNAYTLANEENKWNEISESLSIAKNYFGKMFEIIDENDKRRMNIEKTNTIINDFENSIVLNDKNIFFMQYKNTIQALETL